MKIDTVLNRVLTIYDMSSRIGELFRKIFDLVNEVSREIDRFFEEEMKRLDEFVKEVHKEVETVFKEPVKGKRIVWGFEIYFDEEGRPHIKKFGNVTPTGLREEVEPYAEVREEKDKYVIIIELPGVEKENIKVTVRGNVIDVKAASEYRRYRKEIKLPFTIDPNKVKARYRNGVLTIEVVKPPEVQGRQITVE